MIKDRIVENLEYCRENQNSNDCESCEYGGRSFQICERLVDDILVLLKEHPEIIKCKDCKYCIKEPNGELYCDILAVGYEPLGSKKVNADWFCADGERKIENGYDARVCDK